MDEVLLHFQFLLHQVRVDLGEQDLREGRLDQSRSHLQLLVVGQVALLQLLRHELVDLGLLFFLEEAKQDVLGQDVQEVNQQPLVVQLRSCRCEVLEKKLHLLQGLVRVAAQLQAVHPEGQVSAVHFLLQPVLQDLNAETQDLGLVGVQRKQVLQHVHYGFVHQIVIQLQDRLDVDVAKARRQGLLLLQQVL